MSHILCDKLSSLGFMDRTCTDKCLLKIALLPFDWKSLGRNLLKNIEQDVEDIEHEEKEEQHKREKMLLKWKKQQGSGATCRKLIHTLKEIGNEDTAERVKQLAVEGMLVEVSMYDWDDERAVLHDFKFLSMLHSKTMLINVLTLCIYA